MLCGHSSSKGMGSCKELATARSLPAETHIFHLAATCLCGVDRLAVLAASPVRNPRALPRAKPEGGSPRAQAFQCDARKNIPVSVPQSTSFCQVSETASSGTEECKSQPFWPGLPMCRTCSVALPSTCLKVLVPTPPTCCVLSTTQRCCKLVVGTCFTSKLCRGGIAGCGL